MKHHSNKNRAFTLAEVLITLGIIGVVAAITMPVLISKYRAQIFESQFKKAYSSVQNATKMLVEQDISPYYDYSSEGNKTTPTSQLLLNQTDAYSKIMLGTICPDRNQKCGGNWKNLTGKTGAHVGAISASKAFMLNDGMLVLIGSYHWIFVDINGPNKGPNRSGYDWHVFKITEDNNVKPVTYPEDRKDTRTCTMTNPSSTDSYLGYGCTGYAVMNKNPDGDGDYWHDFLKL